MPYRFIENEATADVAIEVINVELSELFRDSGNALIKTMIENPEGIKPQINRLIVLKHDQLDLLLYNFLEQLLYYKDTEQLLLLATRIAITKAGDEWELASSLAGESLDPSRHQQRIDVKAVTLHQLSLHQDNHIWKAHFVLDV
jgi:SHS2 domain-containing protein